MVPHPAAYMQQVSTHTHTHSSSRLCSVIQLFVLQIFLKCTLNMYQILHFRSLKFDEMRCHSFIHTLCVCNVCIILHACVCAFSCSSNCGNASVVSVTPEVFLSACVEDCGLYGECRLLRSYSYLYAGCVCKAGTPTHTQAHTVRLP